MQRHAVGEGATEGVMLLQYEPFMQQCLRVVESTCFAQDIACSVRGQPVGDAFRRHVREYYTPFCQRALRLMYFCGFVPWRVRTLPSGDKVPEALPLGSFEWNVRAADRDECRAKPLLRYEVTSCTCGVPLKEVHVYEMTPPAYTRALHECTAPMFFIVKAYREYTLACERQEDAAEWNSRPQLACTATQKIRVNAGPSGEAYARGGREGALAENECAQRNEDVRAMLRRNDVTGRVNLYTMPIDADAVLLARLETGQDTEVLLQRYQTSVCNLVGIPVNTVLSMQNSADTSAAAYTTNSRTFMHAMRRMGALFEALLEDTYKRIYAADAIFTITPTPKIEIQSMDDLEKAVRCGAVSMETLGNIASTLAADFPLPRYLKHPARASSRICMLRAPPHDSAFDCALKSGALRLNLFAAAEQASGTPPWPPPNSFSQPKKNDPPPPKDSSHALSVAAHVRLAVMCGHALVVAMLGVSAVPEYTQQLSMSLLLVPCVWLVPAVYHLALVHDPSAHVSLLCGLAYIALFPAWLVQSVDGDEELLLASMAVTSAVAFYAMPSDATAALIGVAGTAGFTAAVLLDRSKVVSMLVLRALLACTLVGAAVLLVFRSAPQQHRVLDTLV